MKTGDLVKFVGHARFYRGRVGVVTKTYGPQHRMDSALVYFAGAERQGRCQMAFTGKGDDSANKRRGWHPMAFSELEVTNEAR